MTETGDVGEPIETTLRQYQRERIIPEIAKSIALAKHRLAERTRPIPVHEMQHLTEVVNQAGRPVLEWMFPISEQDDPILTRRMESIVPASANLADALDDGSEVRLFGAAIDLGQVLLEAVAAFMSTSANGTPEYMDATALWERLSTSVRHLRLAYERRLRSDTETVLEEIRQVSGDAGAALENIRQASGTVGVDSIGRDYEVHAKSEGYKGVAWVTTVAVFVVGSVGLAYLNLRGIGGSFSAREIGQLALTVPLLLFAAYASRQAHLHRAEAIRSRRIAVQLKTAPAFTDGLDAADKKEVMKALGMRVFGGEDGMGAAGVQFGLLAEAVEALRGTTEKLVDLVKPKQ